MNRDYSGALKQFLENIKVDLIEHMKEFCHVEDFASYLSILLLKSKKRSEIR